MTRTVFLYLGIGLFILGWWGLAFQDSFWKYHQRIDLPDLPTELTLSLPSPLLSSLNRQELTKALQGNYPLIVKKMTDWDIDASLLEEFGITNIQRLPQQLLLKSHYLLRKIQSKTTLPVSYPRTFLPQTFASASLLLTLLPPEAIAALPAGIRKMTQLYPEEMTSKIPMTLDKFETEKIFLMKPQLAFVSDVYSDPVMIHSLKNQGISIVFISSLSNIVDIQHSLQIIGNSIGKSEEAELLSIFIEASLIAIENRWHAIKTPQEIEHLKKHGLYLGYNTHFQLPQHLTVTSSLLQRLGISFSNTNPQNKTTLTQEDLVQINPDYLLISTADRSKVEHLLTHCPGLDCLKALRQQNLFWLDDEIQQTPTHHVVLAYFDLVNALTHVRL